MKITHEMDGGTVGDLAAFLAHAIATGVRLEEPIAMKRDRGSSIVELTIEVDLAAFATPADAAGELRGVTTGERARPPRSTRGDAPRQTGRQRTTGDAPQGGKTGSLEDALGENKAAAEA